MTGMIGFTLLIIGATGFASNFGWSGFWGFLLMAMIVALVLRARKLRRV